MNFLKLEALIKTDPFNPLHHIALARAYLEEGDEERARKIIATKRRLPSQDATVHFEWGRLCEELGMARQAVESYEQAIALNPQNPEYHFRIALLYYERGAWERVLKHLQKTISISPENQEAKRLLASLYEEMGLKGLSEVIRGQKEKKEYILETIPFQLKKEDFFVFSSLFQGREFGYARYKTESPGYLKIHFINGLFGMNELIKHLEGEESFGIYPLRSDKTVKFSVIRIRIPKVKLLANIKNEGFLAITEDHVHQYARSIYLTMKDVGLSGYMENSGGRERRIWFFFEEFIPYDLAERFLNHVLNQVLSPGVDLTIDFLLGYKASGIGWIDEPVLLPLGINLETGKRCYFLNDEGIPYENQFLFIHKIRRIGLDNLRSFLKSMKLRRLPRASTLDLLKRLETRCPVIGELSWKARSGRNLEIEEKLVLFFTVGFLLNGEQILHELLELCPDYRPNKVTRMYKRLGRHPISCPKIRKLMPEKTAYLRCNCSFEIPEGGYPNPLLHISEKMQGIK